MSTVKNLFEDLAAETRTCEKHGEYDSKLLKIGSREHWSPCSKCMDEASEAKNLERQKKYEEDMRRKSIERRLESACIPPRFQSKGFDSYVANTGNQQKALAKCKRYADQFEDNFENGKSLLLLGSVGTGKTHLASAIANQIIAESGYTVLYSTVSSMLRFIRSSFSDSELSESEAYNTFTRPHLLIIDEIGVQKASEFELTALFEIVNERYEQVCPTIIISNHGPAELSNYLGDRVVDRLREGGSVVLFEWESARVKA